MWSYFISAMKVYKAFDIYFKKELPEVCNLPHEGCSIEFCPDVKGKNPKIETLIVYGKNAKSYSLSSLPAPKLK